MNSPSTIPPSAEIAAVLEIQRLNELNGRIEEAEAQLREKAYDLRNLDVAHAQGKLAEQWHKHTFNLDAYKKNLHSLFADARDSNGRASPDIELYEDGKLKEIVQLKYYKSDRETAKQLWDRVYDDNHQKVVPSDQLHGVRRISAAQAELESAGGRPHVVESANHTVEHVSDRVRLGGAESEPLSRKESDDLVEKLRNGQSVLDFEHRLSAEQALDHAKDGAIAGGGVAVAMAAAPHIFRAVRGLVNGRGMSEVDFEQALTGVGKAGLVGAVRGAIAVGLTDAMSGGALGQGLQHLGAGPIGALAAVAANAVIDGVSVFQGKMSVGQFSERLVLNGGAAAGAVKGAAVGQMLIPIPIVGALIGSVVGGLIGRYGARVVTWGARQLAGAFEAMVDFCANTLFAWDRIAEAREQTRQLEQKFDHADAVLDAVAQTKFRAYRDLRLPAFEHARRDEVIADLRSDLERLEAELERHSGRSFA